MRLGGDRSGGGRGGGNSHCPIRLELKEEKDAVNFGGHCSEMMSLRGQN